MAITDDVRFRRPLYSTAEAARLVGMSPSSFRYWSHGYERQPRGRPTVKVGPVITSVPAKHGRSIPFVGLVEAAVVQAFRRTGLPLQRIRSAIEVLSEQGELRHALASELLYTDGAQVLYDYARVVGDRQLRLLTVVSSQQRVFHEVVDEYLKRIVFDDRWATELVLPVTERPLLRVLPEVASGDPIFMTGGAPLRAIESRAKAGEPIASIAHDFDVPPDEISEALRAIWPQALAA